MGDDSGRDWTPRPARGYSWPPFEPGNLAGVRHGVRSERIVAAAQQSVADALLEECPWMADVDRGALERYARAEARARLLDAYIARKTEDGNVEAVKPWVWSEATRADALAQKAAQDLGLDPTGRARLARDLGWAKRLAATDGVAELAHRGRALRDLRAAK